VQISTGKRDRSTPIERHRITEHEPLAEPGELGVIGRRARSVRHVKPDRARLPGTERVVLGFAQELVHEVALFRRPGLNQRHFSAEAGTVLDAGCERLIASLRLMRDMTDRGVAQAPIGEREAHRRIGRDEIGIVPGWLRRRIFVTADTGVERPRSERHAIVDGRGRRRCCAERSAAGHEAEPQWQLAFLQRSAVEGPKALARIRPWRDLDRVQRVRVKRSGMTQNDDPLEQVVLGNHPDAVVLRVAGVQRKAVQHAGTRQQEAIEAQLDRRIRWYGAVRGGRVARVAGVASGQRALAVRGIRRDNVHGWPVSRLLVPSALITAQ